MQNFKPFAKFQVSTFFPVDLVAKAIQVLHFIVDFVVLKVVVSHDSQTITEFAETKGFMTFSPSYPIHYVQYLYLCKNHSFVTIGHSSLTSILLFYLKLNFKIIFKT